VAIELPIKRATGLAIKQAIVQVAKQALGQATEQVIGQVARQAIGRTTEQVIATSKSHFNLLATAQGQVAYSSL